MKIQDKQAWWIRLPNDPKLIAARVIAHTEYTVVIQALDAETAFVPLDVEVSGRSARYITEELIFVEQFKLPTAP